MHSGASQSHTVCEISSDLKMHPFSDLSGACQKKGACIQPQTPSSMVWHILLLETFKTALVCLLICCDETVHLCALPLDTYSTKWCLSLKKMYSLYILWMFPNCLSVAPEAPLRTRKGCMQLLTSHDNNDPDGKTNDFMPFSTQ